jgi:CheY-like chemotaxis protein
MGTVLVVDDEFGVADLIDAVLTDEGHRVLTAANGRQGLELLAKEPPDMVFLDYMMPVMDGATVLRRINDDPAWRSIPVVLMSSMPEAAVADRCSGYATFMRKPFRISEVIALAIQLIPGSPGQVPE